jgi:hypothetical protein
LRRETRNIWSADRIGRTTTEGSTTGFHTEGVAQKRARRRNALLGAVAAGSVPAALDAC